MGHLPLLLRYYMSRGKGGGGKICQRKAHCSNIFSIESEVSMAYKMCANLFVAKPMASKYMTHFDLPRGVTPPLLPILPS